MKIVNVIVNTLVIVMMLAVPSMAQTNETNDTLPDAGVTPDSMLYFLDVAMDNLALALTFNDDDKIEKELEIARERLAEVKKMAEKGDVEAMQKASDEHGKTLAKLKAEVKNIENSHPDGELRKEIEIERKIKYHSDAVEDVEKTLKIHIEVEGEITAEQQAMIDSILNSLKGQTGEVEIEIENEKERTKIKIEAETGKDGDEIEIEIENELGITAEQKEDAMEEIDEARTEMNETLEEFDALNQTPPQEVVDEINQLLDDAQAAFDAGDFKLAEELADEAGELVEELEEIVEEHEEDESSEHEEDESVEHMENESSEHEEDESVEHMENESSEHEEDETIEHMKNESSEHVEDETSEHMEDDSSEHVEDETSEDVEDESSEHVEDETSEHVESTPAE